MGVGGGGGVTNRVNFGTGVPAIFQNLPHSYTWPSKNGPSHILDHPKC